MIDRIKVSHANILYLVCILLVAVLGSASQVISPTWGLLFTEVVLILAPALLVMRLGKVNLPSVLRPQFPPFIISAACFLLGIGAWLLDGFLETAITQGIYLVFKASPLPSSLLPKNVGEAILFAAGFVLFAPLCEEILFRGTIQRAYQPYGAGISILIPASLFILFHMRFLGLVPLVLIALLISFVYHRTRSLGAAMLVHAGNNLLVGIQMILFAINPSLVLPLPSAPGALAGLLLAAASLYLLLSRKLPGHPEEVVVPPPAPAPTPVLRVWAFLPLLPAVGVYLVMAGLEFVSIFFPGILALDRATGFMSPAWQEPVGLAYTIYNKNDDVVGNSTCSLITEEESIQLVCQTKIEGFEFTRGNSYYSADSSEQTLEAAWDYSTAHLLSFEKNELGENYRQHVTLETRKGESSLLVETGEDELFEMPLSADAALPDEVPFRMMMLDFSTGSLSKIPVAYLFHYDPQSQQSEPAQISELVIIGQDLLLLDSGEYQLAWKVRLGKDVTMWYESDSPHWLIRMENNMFNYVLDDVSPAGSQ